MKDLIKYWLPVFVWASFIFYLSSVPNLKASPHPFWDELIRSFLHMFFYFVFLLLCWRALRFLSKTKRTFVALFFVFIYSLTDEIHQYFVPTRSFQLKDLLIDNLGSLLAVFSVRNVLSKMPEEFKRWAKKLTLD